MELLIIKNNKDYFRVKDGKYLKCNMDKASVFPLEKKSTVIEHIRQLKKTGETGATIFKLTITEEPYKI